MHLYIAVILASTVTSALHLPLIEVSNVAHKDLKIMEFIEQSYQPLVITGSLGRGTVAALAPWTFTALNTSLEAATTFCVATTGFQSLDDRSEEARSHREKSSVGNEGENKDGTRSSVSDGGLWMSLRRFGVEDGGQWSHAVTIITKDIG